MKWFAPDQFSQQQITDGQSQCLASHLPALFEVLDQTFEHHGQNASSPLVFECVNTVSHAIVLIYLLEREYSFLLIPPLENAQLTPSSLPTFFATVLRIEEGTSTPFSPDQVPQLLRFNPNPAFNTTPQNLQQPGSLYLRTSGSTGIPKLVMHRHERFFENVQRCRARLQLSPSDRVAIPVPLFHMYGLGAGFLPSLSAGASVDLQKGANLLRYIQREQAFNPNIAFLTPIFCEMLLKGRHSARPYRMTVAAGDRVRPHTLTAYEEQFGCLVKLYGSTEMGVMAAASPTDSLEIRSGSVGLPLEGTTFRLAPPPTEVPPELEGLGELWCHNPYGFEGYLDREGTPLVDGSEDFRTKDFGQISPDGRITVVGRCDYSVNRDGLLVFFADIERAIESLDSVEMSVVVAKGESSRGKGLVAYCVPAKDHNPVIAEIRAHCFEHLPKRAVPDSIEILKTLPLLPNGKVDRQALIQR